MGKLQAQLQLFSIHGESAYEMLYELTESENEAVAERAEEILRTLFDVEDEEEYLFLEERLADDPLMAQAV